MVTVIEQVYRLVRTLLGAAYHIVQHGAPPRNHILLTSQRKIRG